MNAKIHKPLVHASILSFKYTPKRLYNESDYCVPVIVWSSLAKTIVATIDLKLFGLGILYPILTENRRILFKKKREFD